MSETRASATRPVDYPESDGQPMGETDEHADALRAAVETLRDHFAPDGTTYVSGNNLLYFVEGEPRYVVSPDCYVVRGVGGQRRPIFKVWEEGGRAPCFVLELTSRSTRRSDLGEKMSIYRDDLRVPEYVLFDLTRDWIPEGLRGFRLEAGVYRPIVPDADGRLPSGELGLALAAEGQALRFYGPGDPAPLPTPAERAARAESRATRAESRAARAESRAESAEAEARALRAELDRLRRGG